jgi:hypothetical protein
MACTAFASLLDSTADAKDLSPLYEETFDIAAGGASLTRATRYGVVFANPALLPFSGSFHRWLGSETSIHINRESVDFAKQLLPGNSSTGDQGAGDSSNEFVDHVLSEPFMAGTQNSLAYLNSYGGIGAFSKFEIDLEVQEYSETGLPSVKLTGKSYQGGTASGAFRLPVIPLSLGLTAKYLTASEPQASIDLADPAALERYQDPTALANLVDQATGAGFDMGALLFFQGPKLDYRFAIKVDDVGGTSFSGSDQISGFKQVASAGAAITVHTGKDAVHLALDRRDLFRVYGTPSFKATRAGVKVILRNWIGLAAGFYDGYPSAGAEVDLFFIKLGVAAYRRENSNIPGLSPRNIYIANLAAGF